ncbi:MAG: SGNH/GDSL hydrolase family protein [Oscillospiraceae bacterium]|nr:SGNH/GDSL hydrolase family protein [Oscillospiraceae bacterium]
MKKIFLIGDSIRFGAANSPGYGVYVKEKLQHKAEVYAPDENCRFAQYTLRNLYDWAMQFDTQSIDVVHWNNGLWDVLRLHGDEPLTPLNVYLSFLERVYKKIRLIFPKAKIIFALSTPVVEKWANPDFMRYNREIRHYNREAEKLMDSLGVQVNDLYSVAEKFDESMRADWVHYNEKGSELLADAVVRAIQVFID